MAAEPSDRPPGACPRCLASPFEHFLRGRVARSSWPWWAWLLPLARWRRPRFAVICRACKAIVDYEWRWHLDL